MRITSVSTLCLSRRHEPERQWKTASFRAIKADCAIIIIDTDSGIRGIGEPSAYGDPARIRKQVTNLASGLIGHDPLDPNIMPDLSGGKRSNDIPRAGIDCALWDLRARIEGKRICEMVATATGPSDAIPAQSVRLYASGGVSYDWNQDPIQLVREAYSHIATGFTAFKMRVGTEWSRSGITTSQMIDLLHQVTEAVDGRMELMLDGNSRLSELDAHTIASALDDLHWAWFEEPMPLNPLTYARLNDSVDIPITGGESFSLAKQFEPYLEAGAFTIAQPDVGVCGVSEWLRIVNHAYGCGVEVCPHSWHNGLLGVSHAHLLAALPRPRPLELCMVQGPLQWEILHKPPPIEDGHLVLPKGPGWGVDIAEDIEKKFPYIEGDYADHLD